MTRPADHSRVKLPFPDGAKLTVAARIQCTFTAAELRDLLAGLDMRLAALADARPGFRSPMRARVEETATRLSTLAADLQRALDNVTAPLSASTRSDLPSCPSETPT